MAMNSNHKDTKSIDAARMPLSKFCDVFEHIDKASRDDRYLKLDTTEFSRFLGFDVAEQQDIGDYIDAFGETLSDALASCQQGKCLSVCAQSLVDYSAALNKKLAEVSVVVCVADMISLRTPGSMRKHKLT